MKAKKSLISPILKDKLSRRNRFESYTNTFLGHKLHIHDYASFRLGYKELFKQEVYKFSSAKTNPYIIDCGSNMGMSIIYFKTLFPAARILSFEADPHIFEFLEKNIKSFALENVTAYNNAVWDTNDDSLPFLAEGGAGGRVEKKSEAGEFINVKTARLRDYLNEEVDFLKIDIEGAEFKVLADCSDRLSSVKNLFIEYHSMADTEQNLHQILEIASRAGFRYHISAAYTTPAPFVERRLNFGMDLQLNIFCYRP